MLPLRCFLGELSERGCLRQAKLPASDMLNICSAIRHAQDAPSRWLACRAAQVVGAAGSKPVLLPGLSQLPDETKSEADVRRELAQLREVCQLEAAEMAKVRAFAFEAGGGGVLGGAGVRRAWAWLDVRCAS